MRLLLISYYFPPDRSAGGFRASSFCKYFHDKGIKVDLLTSNRASLSKGIKEAYNIREAFVAPRPKLRDWGYKTKILAILELLKLDTLLFFPDIFFPWIKKAVKAGIRALKLNKYDAILATAPPFSVFFVGYDLSKRFNIPLILDYRDPWNDQPFKKIPWPVIKHKHKKWENKIASSATMIFTVGGECAKMISASANVSLEKINVIHNGFFAEDLPDTRAEKDNNIFTIGYFGNIYLLRKRCFETFMRGFAKFISQEQLSSKEVRIVYAGGTSRKSINKIVSKNKMKQFFKDLGLLNREQAYLEIQKCDLTLLFIPREIHYVLPTKIFDYLSNHTHVLIIGSNGEASNLCEKVDQQYSIAKCDENDVAEKLKGLYSHWKNGTLRYGCDSALLKNYDRKVLAYKYAEKIIQELSV